MIPRNGGTGGNRQSMPTSIRPSIKKKPPPPRPPQPKINRLQSSMSFNTAQDLTSARYDGVTPRPTGKDLIDFSTPPGSPGSGRRNTVSGISVAKKDPNDWCYRVGASIFYIKSPLKNSVPEAPVQNPFSPPRPTTVPANVNSAWSPVHTTTSTQKSAWDSVPEPSNNQAASASNTFSSNAPVSGVVQNAPFQNTSSLDNNNTIKSHYQQSAWIPAGVSSSSNASSNRSSGSSSDAGGGGGSFGKPRYGNVPVALHKELSATLSSSSGTGSGIKPKAPTIIRPATKVTTQLSKEPLASSNSVNSVVSSFENSVKAQKPTGNGNSSEPVQRNYYDVPPDEDDFDDDEEDEDEEPTDASFMSPPMPSEPAPVLHLENAASIDYPDTYSDSAETAYALALYDLQPQVEGDLALQTGDLVYLLRRIDDNWYYGSCGGVEGMVPTNFLNVMVPLDDIEEETQTEAESEEGIYTVAEFEFPAETDSDLSLKVGDMVKVLGRINEDWLYGEIDGSKGQFPAAFVQPILQDLPIIKI